jgi:hypothetical protein
MKDKSLKREPLRPFLVPIADLWNGARKQLNILRDEDLMEACNENDHLLADIEERQFDEDAVSIPVNME